MIQSVRDTNQPVAFSRDDPPSADEVVAKLRLKLRHLSVVELVEEELVKWDGDEHVVTKGPKFDEKRPELNLVEW